MQTPADCLKELSHAAGAGSFECCPSLHGTTWILAAAFWLVVFLLVFKKIKLLVNCNVCHSFNDWDQIISAQVINCFCYFFSFPLDCFVLALCLSVGQKLAFSRFSEKYFNSNVLFLLLFSQHHLFTTATSFWWKKLTWKYELLWKGRFVVWMLGCTVSSVIQLFTLLVSAIKCFKVNSTLLTFSK